MSIKDLIEKLQKFENNVNDIEFMLCNRFGDKDSALTGELVDIETGKGGIVKIYIKE